MDWKPHLPLVAILRGIEPKDALEHIEALIDAGFYAIEIPTNSPEWDTSVRLAVERFGERALIGGGTMLREAQIDTLADVGGRLVVTPNTRPALIRHAVSRGLYVAAGIATPTEAFDALDAGAEALKVFPASTYGTGFIRAIRAVLPPVPVFAVGGVTPENLAEYIAAGCLGAGLGSDLYKAGQPLARTEEKARAFVQAYKEATR